jgi:hypothetical protein
MAAAAASTPQQQPSFGQARQWVPSLPTSLIASLNPFASAQPKDTTDAQQNGDNQRSALSLIAQDSGPPSPTKSSVSIMFAEPESQGTSLSGSREGSIDGKRRAKRNNKPKSTYTICHDHYYNCTKLCPTLGHYQHTRSSLPPTSVSG